MKRKQIGGYSFLKFASENITTEALIEKSEAIYSLISARRSIREFSDREVPVEVLNNCILAASSAPSGANKQPWTFCLVRDPILKKKIRDAAEKEEYESYNGRMSSEWIEDLKPLGTDWHKPFLETAPYLIVVFRRIFEFESDGRKHPNYYVQESVGIACGFLLAALHQTGLSALTHTPSPMSFLSKLLNRPENEKPFLLIPVGFAAEDCWVPDIGRKSLEEICITY
jgi:nitroreductase